jgi:hypothetical protein
VRNAEQNDHKTQAQERTAGVGPTVVDHADSHQPCGTDGERWFDDHPGKAAFAPVDNGCDDEHDRPSCESNAHRRDGAAPDACEQHYQR